MQDLPDAPCSTQHMQDFYLLHLGVYSACNISTCCILQYTVHDRCMLQYAAHASFLPVRACSTVYSAYKISTCCTLQYTAHTRFLPIIPCSTQHLQDFYLLHLAVHSTSKISAYCTLQYKANARGLLVVYTTVYSAYKMAICCTLQYTAHARCLHNYFTVQYTAHARCLSRASVNTACSMSTYCMTHVYCSTQGMQNICSGFCTLSEKVRPACLSVALCNTQYLLHTVVHRTFNMSTCYILYVVNCTCYTLVKNTRGTSRYQFHAAVLCRCSMPTG
jgi:hypothetical protein